MKANEFLAFLLTLAALIILVAGIGTYLAQNYTRQSLDCGYFSIEAQPEFDNIQLQKGKGELVKVTVNNIGIEDEYKVSIRSPDWVMVKPKKIRVEQGESTDLFVYMSPTFDSEGNYDVVLNLKSYCLNEDFVINVNVE